MVPLPFQLTPERADSRAYFSSLLKAGEWARNPCHPAVTEAVKSQRYFARLLTHPYKARRLTKSQRKIERQRRLDKALRLHPLRLPPR